MPKTKKKSAAVKKPRIVSNKDADHETESIKHQASLEAVSSAQSETQSTLRSRGRAESKRPQDISKIPNAVAITKKAWKTIWYQKKLFAGISAIYLTLALLLTGGIAGTSELAQLQDDLKGANVETSGLTTGLAMVTVLIVNSGSSSGQVAMAYHSFILLIVSLALIWALRHTYPGKKDRSEKIRVRDSFYKGMYPLVPVLLLICVVGVQLLPMLLGAIVYSMVVTGGIATTVFEQVLWAGVFAGLSLLSLYMISASVISIYIAGLPDMPPMRAFRSAQKLVKYNRWSIMRKLLFLPLLILVSLIIVMLPIVLVATPIAPIMLFLISAVVVAFVHSYLYTLYRELLPA